MPRSTSWWWLVAGLPGPYMHPPLAGALDVSTGNRAGEPPPQRTGSGAAGMSNLARQAAPLDAHAADLQHLAFGPPHSHAPQTHASDNAASSGARGGVPPARMHATLTAVGDGRLFLFGGTAARRQPGGSRYLNDLFVFDSAKRGAWSAEQLARPACCDDNALVDALGPRPAPRTQHAAAWDGHSSRVFVFGGMTDQVGFNGEAASRKQYSGYSTTTRGGEAGGRAEAQADEGFMDPSASSQDRDDPSSPVYLNDLHYFDTAADALWQGTPPGESGGTTQRGAGGDLSASSGRAMRWSGKLTVSGRPPSPRASHAMVKLDLSPGGSGSSGCSSAGSSALFVFGGRSGSRLLNDLHRLDLDTLEWTQVAAQGSAPSPRHYFGACESRNELFVFGGLWQAVASPDYPTPDGLRTFEAHAYSVTDPAAGLEAPFAYNATASPTAGAEAWERSSSYEAIEKARARVNGGFGAVNGGEDPRAARALGGLFAFSPFSSWPPGGSGGQWRRVDGQAGQAGPQPATLGRHPRPASNDLGGGASRVPAPRFNAVLAPVASGGLWLSGGVDGALGTDLDEVLPSSSCYL